MAGLYIQKMVRKCAVCEKDIKIFKVKHIPIKKNSDGPMRYSSILKSKEGMRFGITWFCNDCWNEIKTKI